MGIIDKKDVEEMAIKDVVKEAMQELPLRMEEFILAYQLIHGSDKEYAGKINLLNDMVMYSKIKFLEEKGLYKSMKQNEKTGQEH